MRPIRIAAIIGTRPEAIKLAPVIFEARSRPDRFEISIMRSGQHRELVDQLLEEFGLRADVNLDLMRPDQGLAWVMAESVRGLSEAIARAKPDWVLVQGDTTTTFAGALAAFYNRVRVGHVEAGLRTHQRHTPFPEEANRSLTARLADLHFAPTPQARLNLLREGIADDRIIVTGNTVVDALLQTLARASCTRDDQADPPDSRYILVTAHRRENHGAGLGHICDAVSALLDQHPDVDVRIPMHPSPNVRRVLDARLGRVPRVRLTEPLGYTDFVRALNGATLVLTDSGGVQEECAALGKPVLVLRGETERSEAVDAGVAALVGTDPRQIVALASRLLNDREAYRRMARPTGVFGEGGASIRILDALQRDER